MVVDRLTADGVSPEKVFDAIEQDLRPERFTPVPE
jgi:hypothetical protein